MGNRVALVTGGARGIGYGISETLAREGYDLAICGQRDAASVAEPMEALEQLGGQVHYVSADISDGEARQRLLASTRERFGRLDVLVNNAGVGPLVRADILETTEESYDRVMNINLRGPMFLTQAVARWMLEQKQEREDFAGTIVFVTSISSTVASTNRVEYCISKAGLSMAAQTWAVRLAAEGIPVYDVRPGLVRTDMNAAVQDRYDRMIDEGLTLQPRWGTPGDVARAVAMLARGDLAYSTGQVIMVEGGMLVDRM